MLSYTICCTTTDEFNSPISDNITNDINPNHTLRIPVEAHIPGGRKTYSRNDDSSGITCLRRTHMSIEDIIQLWSFSCYKTTRISTDGIFLECIIWQYVINHVIITVVTLQAPHVKYMFHGYNSSTTLTIPQKKFSPVKTYFYEPADKRLHYQR